VGLLNGIAGVIVQVLVSPFKGIPWLGLVLVSAVAGAAMLVIYKYTSNQAGIKRAKDRIKAHLFEMLLYRDDIVVSFRAQGRILKANLVYMAYAVVPLLVILPVVLLILSQLEAWYGMRPLKVGESTQVKVVLGPGGTGLPTGELQIPEGLSVETPAYRSPAGSEVMWRVRAVGEGQHEMKVVIDGAEAAKSVVVGAGLHRLSERRGRSFLDRLLYPVEKPLPKDSGILAIDIQYPDADVKMGPVETHWLVFFFVLSILFAFALRGPLGVEI